MIKDDIIINLSKYENISKDNLIKYIKSFEKLIKSESKKYQDISGLEDYKMHYIDYEILFTLYINTKPSALKLEILLYFIYSYYKMDGIDYSKKFPIKLFFTFIKNNNNLHKLIIDFFK